jgi:hypothetical protein
MNTEPSDGGRGGTAFNVPTDSYNYTDDYEDEKVTSLPTAAEERKLLDIDEYDEQDDEGRVVSVNDDAGKEKRMAPDEKYRERRHDRVVREGMSYKEVMEGVNLERERSELEKEEKESVAVVSRWDEDSSKSSGPRR